MQTLVERPARYFDGPGAVLNRQTLKSRLAPMSVTGVPVLILAFYLEAGRGPLPGTRCVLKLIDITKTNHRPRVRRDHIT